MSPAVPGSLPEGIVTFLLTDIEGSTRLWDVDPDRMAPALEAHEQLVVEVVHAHDGTVLLSRGEGDSTLSVFARPSDGLQAALELQRRLRGGAWPHELRLPTRMALHTGEAQLRDGIYYGSTLNRAARIRSLARGGEVFCSRATHDLVADRLPADCTLVHAGEHELRGLRRAESVYTLAHPDLPEARTATSVEDSTRIFVARSRELDFLLRSAADVEAGSARLVLISGEAGIGKTTLLEHLCRRPELARFDVLWGRCYEHEGAPPFWPWLQVLRADRPEGAALADGSASGTSEAAVLAQLLPELAGGHAPVLPELDHDAARFRLFEAIAAIIRRAASARSLAFVFDDVHWADEASLALLAFVSRQLADAPVLLFATYRELDARARTAISDQLADLIRAPGAASVHLRGLAVEDVAQYVTAVHEHPVHESLVVALHDRTDGNPFFLAESVRYLASRGQLDALRLAPQLPDSIRAGIGLRLRALSDDQLELLRLAAVVGREFDERDVTATTDGDITSVSRVLDATAAFGLTATAPGTGSRRHRFVHALVRDVVYDDTPSELLRHLHAEVAEAIVRHDGERLDERLETVARHFVAAIPSCPAERAIAYCGAAGDRAAAVFAYEDAASLFETAIELLDLLDHRPTDVAIGLELKRGDALERAGREPAAQSSYLTATQLSRSAGDASSFATGVVGLSRTLYFYTSAGSGARRDELFREALSAIPEGDSTARARLLAALADDQYVDTPYEERAALAADAVAMARRLGDDATLCFALNNWQGTAWVPENLDQRRAAGDEAQRIARRLADRRYELWTQHLRFATSVEALDGPGMVASLTAMEQLGEILGDGRSRWAVLLSRAHRLTITGRFDEAERAASEALAALDSGNLAGEEQRFAGQVGALLLLRGRLDSLADALRALANEQPGEVWLHALTAVLAMLGRDDEARRQLQDLHPDATTAPPLRRDSTTLVALASLILAASTLKDRPRTRRLYDALVPFEARMVTVGQGVSSIGPVSYYLGVAAAALGDHERAILHYERAMSLLTSFDATPFIAQCQVALAESLLANRSPANLERAEALARTAHTTAAELDMLIEQSRAGAVIRAVARRQTVDAARRRFGAPYDAFVGRGEELAQLDDLLVRPGLVTLTGPGGIGKTRLAQEAAARAAVRFHRSWFVALAGIPRDADIAATIEAVVAPAAGDIAGSAAIESASAIDRLRHALASTTALLVVDNCEHVRPQVASVISQLQGRSPQLTVLATSRERLSVPGESVVAVPPLTVPRRHEDAGASGALHLLRERAQIAGLDSLPDDDIEALLEICRAVDGMPLGIELAAARLDSTSARDLAARINSQLDLLRGDAPREERHRTLDATIDWSYGLLDPDARTLLRRLSVFAGGFTLDAAERVCTEKGAGLPDAASVHLALAELVSKSLVVFDREQGRYRLLVPVQLYARRLLDEGGEAGNASHRHAAWVLELARDVSRAQLEDSPDALPELASEADNVEAAFRWCDGAEHDMQLRLAARLGFAWYADDWRRGLRLVRRVTRERRGASATLWAGALLSRGMLEQREDLDASVPWLRECLEVQRNVGSRSGEAWASFWLGKGTLVIDSKEACNLLEACIALFRELGDALGEAWGLLNLFDALQTREEHAEARPLVEQAAAIARAHNLRSVLGSALADLGMINLRDGDVEGARTMLQEAIRMQRGAGDLYNIPDAVKHAGFVELADGQLDAAERLLREALTLSLEQYDTWQLCDTLVGVAKLCLLRGDRDEARLYAAATGWDVDPPLGRGLSSQAITALALREIVGAASAPNAEAEGRRLGVEAAAHRFLA